ncbi:MAG: response regulator [Clostridiaceae bacterium]|nr:response regulator [Clostridiaceae bacterium]
MYGVCLIDDEYYVLKSLENRLDWNTIGFRILGMASSAAEGLAMCERLRPDVVFTDIKMPGMDGLNLIRSLKSAYPDILTIVISGYAEFAYAKEALNLGAIGFCSKPFDDNELCDILQNAKRILDARGERANAEDDVQGPAHEICVYLRTHYADKGLTAQSVAEEFGFHPNYLSQMFKKATGENLIAFLTRIRIEHACTLLQQSNLSAGEIGERVGYPEYFYFAKVFKKQTGLTLSEYRKGHI